MKALLIILTITALVSCEKPEEQKLSIEGTWDVISVNSEDHTGLDHYYAFTESMYLEFYYDNDYNGPRNYSLCGTDLIMDGLHYVIEINDKTLTLYNEKTVMFLIRHN